MSTGVFRHVFRPPPSQRLIPSLNLGSSVTMAASTAAYVISTTTAYSLIAETANYAITFNENTNLIYSSTKPSVQVIRLGWR